MILGLKKTPDRVVRGFFMPISNLDDHSKHAAKVLFCLSVTTF